MSKQELQALFMEFQELNGMMQQLEKQQQLVSSQLIDLMIAKQNLEDLKDVKKGTPILVPISSGVYAKAKIEETDQYIVNIGSNITVIKSVEQAQQMLEKQAADVKEMQDALEQEMQENTIKATMLEQRIQKLASQKQ